PCLFVRNMRGGWRTSVGCAARTARMGTPETEHQDAQGAAGTRGVAVDPNPDPDFIEREPELAQLGSIAGEAAEGAGRVGLVRGPAGIGKTQLLDSARSQAEAAGMRVLSARGGELEREFPFGCVRQLFEPLVHVDARDRAEIFDGDAALA